MLYDQHCSILLAEFNMFTKNAYVRGYETSGEEKNKGLFLSPPLVSRFAQMPRSRRLAHKATVMQARY